jgi:hypothetical protein
MQNTSEEILRLYVREQVARDLTEEKLDEALIDKLQLLLDALGLIPGAGEFFDAANALISLVRGKNLDALLSVISLVPVYGDAIGKGSKIALRLIEPLLKIPSIDKILTQATTQAGKLAGNIDPAMLDKLKKAGEEAGDVISVINKNSEGIRQIFDSMKEGDLAAFLKAIGQKGELGAAEPILNQLFSAASQTFAGSQLDDQLDKMLSISNVLEQARMGLLDKKPAVAAESVNLNVSTLRENYEYLWVE